MEKSDKDWSLGLVHGLELLSLERTNADVTIWTGNQKILAHRLVLDINSDIMKSDDVSLTNADGKYHVFLSQEFEENFELLCNLITSFYTGMIEIKDGEANFVYKFAKVYEVDWLKKKMLSLYEGMLTEKTFVTIFQFSHWISCEDLKGLCLEYLTENLFDSLMESGQLLTIDYHCIKTMCDSTKTYSAYLPAMKKFELICRWFEKNVEDRMCHLESLVSLLELNTLSKSDVTSIFDWILQNKHIPDNRRINLVRKVNGKWVSPIDKISAMPETQQGLKDYQKCLNKIREALLNKATPTPLFCVTFQEFCSVIEHHFQQGNSVTKNLLTEFLLKSFDAYITNENFTDLIRLNARGFSIFPVIELLGYGGPRKIMSFIPGIRWDELPFENLQKFFINSKQSNKIFGDFIYNIRIVECVMNWALQHPGNREELWKLMNNVCLCCFPYEYLELLLKPYILKTNCGGEVVHQCVEHGVKTFFKESATAATGNTVTTVTNKATGTRKRLECYTNVLHPAIRMIKDYSYCAKIGCRSYELRFRPKSDSLFELVWAERRTAMSNCAPMLILFSKRECMERYPILSACNLQLSEFREMVAKYSDLSFLVMPSTEC